MPLPVTYGWAGYGLISLMFGGEQVEDNVKRHIALSHLAEFETLLNCDFDFNAAFFTGLIKLCKYCKYLYTLFTYIKTL